MFIRSCLSRTLRCASFPLSNRVLVPFFLDTGTLLPFYWCPSSFRLVPLILVSLILVPSVRFSVRHNHNIGAHVVELHRALHYAVRRKLCGETVEGRGGHLRRLFSTSAGTLCHTAPPLLYSPTLIPSCTPGSYRYIDTFL